MRKIKYCKCLGMKDLKKQGFIKRIPLDNMFVATFINKDEKLKDFWFHRCFLCDKEMEMTTDVSREKR